MSAISEAKDKTLIKMTIIKLNLVLFDWIFVQCFDFLYQLMRNVFDLLSSKTYFYFFWKDDCGITSVSISIDWSCHGSWLTKTHKETAKQHKMFITFSLGIDILLHFLHFQHTHCYVIYWKNKFIKHKISFIS